MDNDKKIIGVVTSNESQKIINAPQRPMILQMPMMQQLQAGQMPFPLLFFLFPRIAMLLMMMRGENFRSRRLGVQNITQLVRDKEGRLVEILEFVR